MGLNQFWQKQLESDEDNWVNRVRNLHQKRGYHVARVIGNGQIFSEQKLPDGKVERNYLLRVTFLIKKNQYFYREGQCRIHTAYFNDKKLMRDVERPEISADDSDIRSNPVIELTPADALKRFSYDRKAAVKYAELWWNDSNPAYEFFEVNDCTNYVSQCLRAGGAPMRGYPNRSTGWWYQNQDWSFSWSVAHAFRWYLSGSTKGLQAVEVGRPEDLAPGDVICYDFNGDGRYDHNTIVVAKNADQMPLVNAHTNNSRHRYWDYRDSLAWTPQCDYKFFRIGKDVL